MSKKYSNQKLSFYDIAYLERGHNQGNKSDINLFKDIEVNNDIVYFRTNMINGLLFNSMKSRNIDKEGGKLLRLNAKILNLEHRNIYKNAINHVVIVFNAYLSEKNIKTLNKGTMVNINLLFLGLKSWYFSDGIVLFIVTLKDIDVK